MDVVKQVFGKRRMFGGPRRQWSPGWTQDLQALSTVSPPLSPESLRISVTTPPFGEQALDLNSFKQVRGRLKALPKSAGSPLFSAQSNPSAKETFWGSKFCSPTVFSAQPTPQSQFVIPLFFVFSLIFFSEKRNLVKLLNFCFVLFVCF